MVGREPPVFIRVCWCFVTPIILLVSSHIACSLHSLFYSLIMRWLFKPCLICSLYIVSDLVKISFKYKFMLKKTDVLRWLGNLYFLDSISNINLSVYSPANIFKKIVWGGDIGTTRPSIYISPRGISTLTEESLLIKLYAVAVYDLRMCIQEDNPSPKHFKGDN